MSAWWGVFSWHPFSGAVIQAPILDRFFYSWVPLPTRSSTGGRSSDCWWLIKRYSKVQWKGSGWTRAWWEKFGGEYKSPPIEQMICGTWMEEQEPPRLQVTGLPRLAMFRLGCWSGTPRAVKISPLQSSRGFFPGWLIFMCFLLGKYGTGCITF